MQQPFLDHLVGPDVPARRTHCSGPAVAEVEGLYRGETVDAKFTRTDGCEIGRWDRLAFLFPVKPGSP
jgi:hypothetical protein